MWNLSRGLGVVVGMVIATAAMAQHTPESLAGAKVVTAHQVQTMVGTGALVVDTRTKAEFAEAHIKGASNIPYVEKSAKRADFDAAQDRFDLSKLPDNKNAAVIFYCNAGECWKSYKASKLAVSAGFRNVHWFRGGIPEWKANALPVE